LLLPLGDDDDDDGDGERETTTSTPSEFLYMVVGSPDEAKVA
jgi:hypothetical protein